MAQPLASASASSSASSHGNYSYQIFINHRGDVKKTFASHLYRRLLRDGFRVFLDQSELERGEEIVSQIERAIATASVHVAIFSARYAQSSWCLDELVLMLESMESRAATVIPVFYNVKPSDLRWTDKKGGYAEAFLNHEGKGRYSKERLAGWRKALYDVSHISGFELEACNGDEGVLVDEVVRQVQKKVGKPPLLVATHQTGLDEKLQQLETKVLWERQHNRAGPNLVAIVGLGGVGKTTLAKFFFNSKRSDYQQSCFLHDVRGRAAMDRLPSLQIQLYKDLTGGNLVIHNVEEGIAILKDRTQATLKDRLSCTQATLKDRLSCSQALIVMDDVDDVEQLGALFSPVKDVLPSGSLILFTSRDLDLLTKYAGIEESSIYKMTCLDLEHSRQLFCSYAFHQPYPALEYEDLVTKFLNVCQVLPLSLQVIGALLYSGSCEYWKDQLRKLSQVLPSKIQSSLQISYDSLDKEEKEMFLDIACFFIGIKRDTAINVWDGSGWNGSLGLRTLESKCLVTFDEENCLRMHDHLRDLGRELAELPGCPRRLWRPTGSLFRNVPTPSTVRGLSMIQQLSGESSQSPSEFNDRIVDMSGLQLLRAPLHCLERIFKVIRHPELLWLRCDIDPSLSLPSWIQRPLLGVQRCPPWKDINSCLSSWIPIKNLRVLEFGTPSSYGRSPLALGTLWNTEYEAPVELRELNISIGLFELPKSIGQLKYLQRIELHDFRGTLREEFFHLRSLKHLRLRALMESLSDSLGNFTSLQHIDLSGCKSLQALPASFGNLAMLQHIDLSGCCELQTLPDSIENLKQVKYINLSECRNLQRLPQSFGDLTNLQKVILAQCGKLKMLPDSMNLTLLKHLDLRDTNLKELPHDIGDLSNLEILDIGSPPLETLPHSLGKLMKLKRLSIAAPIREVTFASVEKVQGGRRLLDSCIDKCMPRLKQLHLWKTRITEISFGEGVCPVLQELHLPYSHELVEVGGLPTTLLGLNLFGCGALKKISGLRGLAKLRSLNVGGCIEIEDLRDLGVRELDNLTDLSLRECAIGGVLPFASVENVGGDCRLLDSSIDKCMFRLSSLNLSKTRITEISFGEGVCPALEDLILNDCAKLVEVGALPTTLLTLHLYGCRALKKISGLRGLAKLRYVDMRGCSAVKELPGLETLISLKTIWCSRSTRMATAISLACPRAFIRSRI